MAQHFGPKTALSDIASQKSITVARQPRLIPFFLLFADAMGQMLLQKAD